mgnify:CR=1 FL=1
MCCDDNNAVKPEQEATGNSNGTQVQQTVPPEEPMPIKAQRMVEIFSLRIEEDTEESNE